MSEEDHGHGSFKTFLENVGIKGGSKKVKFMPNVTNPSTGNSTLSPQIESSPPLFRSWVLCIYEILIRYQLPIRNPS